MGTKEEWEEIEKSYTKRGEEIKKQYGFDILQVDKDSEETKKKIATANKKLEKFFKIVAVMSIILFLLDIVFCGLLFRYMKKRTDYELQQRQQTELTLNEQNL